MKKYILYAGVNGAGKSTLYQTTKYKVKNILWQYTNELQKIYGAHLKSIILYGSYARGDINLDNDLLIMPIVKNVDHFQYWVETYPFYSNVRSKGVPLYAA